MLRKNNTYSNELKFGIVQVYLTDKESKGKLRTDMEFAMFPK